MTSKTSKSSTAKARGKSLQPRDESEDEQDAPPQDPNRRGAAPADDACPGETGQAVDSRSFEEIVGSIPPPPPPAMTNDPGAPRLMITHIVNQNFKSYAGEQILGPFHKRFSCIIGPNGSGKSNVIDSMLFVFGYRAQKIRSKKLSVLIHSSDQHQDIHSCTVEVHFQKITDKEGDDYDVVPNSKFYVSRTANKDNSSSYHINGKKATFKEVGAVLRSHGIDLDHNRFLILQGEVEQIAMMKPRGQTEHDEGMLEYLEDIIGSGRLKEPINILSRRLEQLNEHRGEKLNRVKMVEKEKGALEAEKNTAVEFLTLENDIFKQKNQLCQYYVHDFQKKMKVKEEERERILEESRDLTERRQKLTALTEDKNQELKNIEKKQNKLSRYMESQKEKFTQLDLQDVEVREKLKHTKTKNKKLLKQLEKTKETVAQQHAVVLSSENIISEAAAQREQLEARRLEEEALLEEVMESLKGETSSLQEDKQSRERELLELSREVNSTRSRMDVARSEMDIYLSRHNTVLSQLSSARTALSTSSSTLQERHAAVKELQANIPCCEEQLKKDEAELQRLQREDVGVREEVKVLRQKVEEAKSSLSSSRSKGKVLDALMQQKRSGNIQGIYGRLGDLGAIEGKYDVAISSCCGALDHILVDTIDTAQQCVMYLKTHNIGFATFIGLDKMKVWERKMAPISTPEGAARLFDMVRVQDESVRPAFYFALRDTLVAQDLEEATRLAFQRDHRWRVVTLKGQIIEMAGTMTGGGGGVMKGRMGSSLTSEVSQEELGQMESQLQQQVNRGRGCEERRLQLEESIHGLTNQLRDMRNTLEKYTRSLPSLAEQQVHLQAQIKELEVKEAAAAPDKNHQRKLQKSLDAFRTEYEAASGRAGKVEAEVQRLHSLILEITSHKLKAQQDRLDQVVTQLDACSSTITKAQVAIKTAGRTLLKAEESIQKMQTEQQEGEELIRELTGQLKTLEEQAGDIMKSCQDAEGALPEVQQQYKSVLEEIQALQKQEHAVQEESLSVKLAVQNIDTCCKEFTTKIKHWEKEGSKLQLHTVEGQEEEQLARLSPEELEGLRGPDVITKQISLLEARCAQLRPNLGAITEYKKKEELFLQRVAELDSITSERDRFKHGVEDVRKQRLNEFMAGFNIITNKLKENYQMLTLGGDAELELVDSLDPFSEGIMFSVRPPKKSWKKIFNLSGGEKTLSSLALVFALHHFKPTPLYFMDEIDAALDFKNVSIVACYIYEQTKNAQFIIISLRNNMFEIADRLIGIYKTHNTTKSVGINPKTIVFQQQEVLTA